MDIFAIITSNVVAVSIVSYLLKIFIEKRLVHSLGKEFELFKSEITKDIAQHSIQAKWLHSKKMEILIEAYEKIQNVDFSLKRLLLNLKIENEEFVRESVKEYSENFLELKSYLHKIEFFLEEELVEEILAHYQKYFELSMAISKQNESISQFSEMLPDSIDELGEVGDQYRKRIIVVFRECVGLE